MPRGPSGGNHGQKWREIVGCRLPEVRGRYLTAPPRFTTPGKTGSRAKFMLPGQQGREEKAEGVEGLVMAG